MLRFLLIWPVSQTIAVAQYRTDSLQYLYFSGVQIKDYGSDVDILRDCRIQGFKRIGREINRGNYKRE
jgi:hypothetical protein